MNNVIVPVVNIPDPKDPSRMIGNISDCYYKIGNLTYDMITVKINLEDNSVVYTVEHAMAKFHCDHFYIKENFLLKA